jgi:hypothetical protein
MEVNGSDPTHDPDEAGAVAGAAGGAGALTPDAACMAAMASG